MSGGWLPWLVGGVTVALVLGIVLWRRRAVRRRTAPPSRRRMVRPPAPRPRAGEIWWADVPYVDGRGSKVRPCLVLRTRRGSVDVLKITSQVKGRADHVRLPTRQWDPRAQRDSYLDVGEPVPVAAAAFVRLAGPCDARVWRAVQRLYRIRSRQ
jgi:mRNA-degrading endonuclease toxin of MazEF toxin-antitoxin module